MKELLTKQQIETLQNNEYFRFMNDLFDKKGCLETPYPCLHLCEKSILELEVVAHFYLAFLNIHYYVISGYKSEMHGCLVYFACATPKENFLGHL